MRNVSKLKSKITLSVSTMLAMIVGLGTWNNIGYQRAYTGLARRARHPEIGFAIEHVECPAKEGF